MTRDFLNRGFQKGAFAKGAIQNRVFCKELSEEDSL